MGIFSEATEQQIRAEVERYQPHKRTALLPALTAAQAELGWLPPEAIARVADLVGVSHPAAAELATFYSMLRLEPQGRTHVEVCVQLPCALAGAERLLLQLSKALGIAPGETTPDGALKLVRTTECFGACHRAPMCRVNEEYCEHLDGDATRKLIEELNARVTQHSSPIPSSPRRVGAQDTQHSREVA